MRVGVAAIRAGFAPALAAKPDVRFLLDIEDIRVDGDHAFLISKYWYESHGGGLPDIWDAGRSLIEYQRDDDGRWKILVDIDQATPDVTFPPSPDAR
jgi:ketosteroid isomerase-like protein